MLLIGKQLPCSPGGELARPRPIPPRRRDGNSYTPPRIFRSPFWFANCAARSITRIRRTCLRLTGLRLTQVRLTLTPDLRLTKRALRMAHKRRLGRDPRHQPIWSPRQRTNWRGIHQWAGRDTDRFGPVPPKRLPERALYLKFRLLLGAATVARWMRTGRTRGNT